SCPRWALWPASTFYGRRRHAGDERLLGEEEEHYDWQAHEQRAGHQQRPGRCAGAGQLLQADGEGVEAVVRQVDEWVEEVGPRPDEDEQRRGCECRAREREDDAAEDLPLVGAVYARRVGDVAGNGRVELP